MFLVFGSEHIAQLTKVVINIISVPQASTLKDDVAVKVTEYYLLSAIGILNRYSFKTACGVKARRGKGQLIAYHLVSWRVRTISSLCVSIMFMPGFSGKVYSYRSPGSVIAVLLKSIIVLVEICRGLDDTRTIIIRQSVADGDGTEDLSLLPLRVIVEVGIHALRCAAA